MDQPWSIGLQNAVQNRHSLFRRAQDLAIYRLKVDKVCGKQQHSIMASAMYEEKELKPPSSQNLSYLKRQSEALDILTFTSARLWS